MSWIRLHTVMAIARAIVRICTSVTEIQSFSKHSYLQKIHFFQPVFIKHLGTKRWAPFICTRYAHFKMYFSALKFLFAFRIFRRVGRQLNSFLNCLEHFSILNWLLIMYFATRNVGRHHALQPKRILGGILSRSSVAQLFVYWVMVRKIFVFCDEHGRT